MFKDAVMAREKQLCCVFYNECFLSSLAEKDK